MASGPWKCIANWSFVPIGFLERCRITTRHPSPFYHVIAERYRDPGRAVRWSPDQDLSGQKGAWERPGDDPKGWTGLREERGMIDIAPGGSAELAGLRGAGAVASLRISLPGPAPPSLRRCRAGPARFMASPGPDFPAPLPPVSDSLSVEGPW